MRFWLGDGWLEQNGDQLLSDREGFFFGTVIEKR